MIFPTSQTLLTKLNGKASFVEIIHRKPQTTSYTYFTVASVLYI